MKNAFKNRIPSPTFSKLKKSVHQIEIESKRKEQKHFFPKMKPILSLKIGLQLKTKLSITGFRATVLKNGKEKSTNDVTCVFHNDFCDVIERLPKRPVKYL